MGESFVRPFLGRDTKFGPAAFAESQNQGRTSPASLGKKKRKNQPRGKGSAKEDAKLWVFEREKVVPSPRSIKLTKKEKMDQIF